MDPAVYMRRAMELALLGEGKVAPNPMVGAVLVHKPDGRILSEGFHRFFGEPHAEPDCISRIKPQDRKLIPQSALFVTLEPCNHYGKTPPCTLAIRQAGIKELYIGAKDINPRASGGASLLRTQGIQVHEGILEEECRALNKRFFTFWEKRRPYIVLKWAQSQDGFMAGGCAEMPVPLSISNGITNRFVHKLRMQNAGILVGTRTAMIDNPALNNRHWPGPQPVRIALDMQLKIPATHQLLDGSQKTIILNADRQMEVGQKHYHKLAGAGPAEICTALREQQINSVLVEGGAALHHSFIKAGLFDEIIRITNTRLTLSNGLRAPAITLKPAKQYQFGSDLVEAFINCTFHGSYFYH